jgi:hypothetical protein
MSFTIALGWWIVPTVITIIALATAWWIPNLRGGE